MAKTGYNPFNRWQGRVGGNVYKVVNGKQVIVPYSGASNPSNTPAQSEVRTRFALSQKIAKIIPAEVIAGLKGNKAERRAALRSLLFNASVASTINGGYIATLDAAKVRLSEGEVFQLTPAGLAIDANGVITGSVSSLPAGIETVMVAAICTNSDGEYVACPYQVLTANNSSVSINLATGLTGSGVTAQVYLVPLSLTIAGAKLMRGGQWATTGVDEYVYTTMLSMEGAYQYAASQYAGQVAIA